MAAQSGSGLGDQSVKMDKTVKTPLSRSSNTTAKVAEGPQVNARNEKGRTALHFACGMSSSVTARSLVEAGADVNACDQDGCTPLHLAAGQRRYFIVNLLLQHGANVFACDRAGLNPREYTEKVCNESKQAQEKLRDGSLQQNIAESSLGDFDPMISLLTNAESKSVDILASATEEPRSIIQRGHSSKQLKIRQLDALGNALIVACAGDVEFVQLLLSGGSPVDFRSSLHLTPLLIAADGGFTNCVQLLLDYGANPNASDNMGITAVIAAAYKGHFECLKVLLNGGASANAVSKGGVTPLIAAAEGCSGVCIQALLQAGGDVTAKTSEGKTALIHAVIKKCIEATEALLNGGSELNAADGEGCTALHYGARHNSVECIRILLDRGADETRKNPLGQTPLEMALKDSEGAQLLEKSWKKLELAIAMRAEELLHQDKLERQSSAASPKPSTRHAREKKNLKKKKKKKQHQEAVEKADHANEELRRDDNESFPSMSMLSPSGSGVTTQPFSLNLNRGLTSDRSAHLNREGFQEHHRSDPPDVSLKQWEKPEISSTPFSLGENASDNPNEWTRVDGKRTGASVKNRSGSPQIKRPGVSIPSGVLLSPSRGSPSKSGEVSSPIGDHLVTERKTRTDSSGVPRNHPKLALQDDCDSKDLESSPSWVQAVLRRTHSDADGTISLQKTPPEAEDRAGEATGHEKTWMECVKRLELELEQARQAEQDMMEKMKQLEFLREANLAQVLELTQSSSRAHHQAETTKTEMQFRICNLEAVVASQTQALEILQAENAHLKLQSRRPSTSLQAPGLMISEPGSRFGVGGGAGLGSGMVRSASESSLYSMGCGTEHRSPLDHLPFIPKAGPKTASDNWFSLVPSPRPEPPESPKPSESPKPPESSESLD